MGSFVSIHYCLFPSLKKNLLSESTLYLLSPSLQRCTSRRVRNTATVATPLRGFTRSMWMGTDRSLQPTSSATSTPLLAWPQPSWRTTWERNMWVRGGEGGGGEGREMGGRLYRNGMGRREMMEGRNVWVRGAEGGGGEGREKGGILNRKGQGRREMMQKRNVWEGKARRKKRKIRE